MMLSRKSKRAIWVLALIAIIFGSSAAALYKIPTVKGINSLAVSISPYTATLSPHQNATFVAEPLNGTGPYLYVWTDNNTIIGTQKSLNFSFPEATTNPTYLTVRVVDTSTGAYGAATVKVQDPYAQPDLYLNALPATVDYVIQGDGNGWYEAVANDGSIPVSNPSLTYVEQQVAGMIDSGTIYCKDVAWDTSIPLNDETFIMQELNGGFTCYAGDQMLYEVNTEIFNCTVPMNVDSLSVNGQQVISQNGQINWNSIVGAPAFLTTVNPSDLSGSGTVPSGWRIPYSQVTSVSITPSVLSGSGTVPSGWTIPWSQVTSAPSFLTTVTPSNLSGSGALPSGWTIPYSQVTGAPSGGGGSSYITSVTSPLAVNSGVLSLNQAGLSIAASQVTGSFYLTHSNITDWASATSGFLTPSTEYITGVNSPLSVTGQTLSVNQASLSIGWSQITGAPAFLTTVTPSNLSGSGSIPSTWTVAWSDITGAPSFLTASTQGWQTTTVTSLATGLSVVSGVLTPQWQAGSVTSLGTGLSVSSNTLTYTNPWTAGTCSSIGSGLTLSLGTLSEAEPITAIGSGITLSTGILSETEPITAIGSGVSLSSGTLTGNWQTTAVTSLATGLSVSSGVLTPQWQAGSVTSLGTGLTISSGALTPSGITYGETNFANQALLTTSSPTFAGLTVGSVSVPTSGTLVTTGTEYITSVGSGLSVSGQELTVTFPSQYITSIASGSTSFLSVTSGALAFSESAISIPHTQISDWASATSSFLTSSTQGWQTTTVTSLATGLSVVSGALTPQWQAGAVTTVGSGLTLSSGVLTEAEPITAIGSGLSLSTGILSINSPLSPSYGGTGVANNVANTITFSGNYGLTLTLTAATSLTLPTSGTLVTTTTQGWTTTQVTSLGTGLTVSSGALTLSGVTYSETNFANQALLTTSTPTFAGLTVGSLSVPTSGTLVTTGTEYITSVGSNLQVSSQQLSLTSNVPLINAANSFTAGQTISMSSPTLTFAGSETGGKTFILEETGGTLEIVYSGSPILTLSTAGALGTATITHSQISDWSTATSSFLTASTEYISSIASGSTSVLSVSSGALSLTQSALSITHSQISDWASATSSFLTSSTQGWQTTTVTSLGTGLSVSSGVLTLAEPITAISSPLSLSSGTLSISSTPSFSTITSTVATGTAPISVTSTTVCTNLNAGYVDGYSENQALLTTSSPTFAGLTVGSLSVPTSGTLVTTGTEYITSIASGSTSVLSVSSGALTLTQSALSITHSQISDWSSATSSFLTSSTEYITSVGSNLQVSSQQLSLTSNVPLINAANVFTAGQTIDMNTPTLALQGTETGGKTFTLEETAGNLEILYSGSSIFTLSTAGALSVATITHSQISDWSSATSGFLTSSTQGWQTTTVTSLGTGLTVSSGALTPSGVTFAEMVQSGAVPSSWTMAASQITGSSWLTSSTEYITGVSSPLSVTSQTLSLGVVGPALGGTGEANNAANTVTFSGNYGLTLTLTAATSLTLPTSGTLVTTTTQGWTTTQVTSLGTGLTVSSGALTPSGITSAETTFANQNLLTTSAPTFAGQTDTGNTVIDKSTPEVELEGTETSGTTWYIEESAGNFYLLNGATQELEISNVGAGIFTGAISGTTITSTVSTGTAPFTVTSTTLVSNLNAQYLNGQAGSYYTSASNINAGTLSPLYGGTGVDQASASSTLTISGAYGITFTVTGTTALTLPTSGTLVTTANQGWQTTTVTSLGTGLSVSSGALTYTNPWTAGTCSSVGSGLSLTSGTLTIASNVLTTSTQVITSLTTESGAGITLTATNPSGNGAGYYVPSITGNLAVGSYGITFNAISASSTSGKLFLSSSPAYTLQYYDTQSTPVLHTIATLGQSGDTAETFGSQATWNGAVISPTYGGTGVAQVASTSTLTLGGAVTFSGAYACTLTLTAATSLTLPTSGTLVTTTSQGWTTTQVTSLGTGLSVSSGALTLAEPITGIGSGLTLSSGSLAETLPVTTAGSGITVSSGTISETDPITTVSAPLSLSSGTLSLSTPLSPTYGGTGVDQASASSTLTISGAYGTTLTVSGTTSLTLPTSGTLLSSTNPIISTPSTTINSQTITVSTTAQYYGNYADDSVVYIYWVPAATSAYGTVTCYISSTSSGGTIAVEETAPESTSVYQCITLYLPKGWYFGILVSSTTAITAITCHYVYV